MKVSTTLPTSVKVTSALITVGANQDTPSGPVQRMMAALQDPTSTFTSDQVAYLMATAARWAREAVEVEPSPLAYAAGFDAGYRARVTEENDEYANQMLIFNAGEHVTALERKKLRDRSDAVALISRTSDHPGGPVDWETGRPLAPFPRVRPTPAPLPADARSSATTPFLTGSAA
jgi:hypothetical protein